MIVKLEEACEHIRQLMEYLATRPEIKIGGCGCCGSPWITCSICGKSVSEFTGKEDDDD